MAEYIERQTVVDMLQNLSYDDWNQGVSTTWANAFSECAEMIRDIPPADVRPVRRGRWVRINKYDEESDVKCPSCNEEFSYIDGVCYLVFGHELPLFCPNCGADMMGGDAE